MINDLAEIKRKVSLLQIAQGKGLKLKQNGAEYWACCPFHTESTPSFAIKQKDGEQVFFCQGCGKGGDVIRFIEYHDHKTTREAIEIIKEMAGVTDLPQANKEWHEGAQQVAEVLQPIEAEKPKKTFHVNIWPQFEKALAENPAAIAWLKEKRGITMETAQRLRLGYTQSYKGKLIKPEDEESRDKGWIMFPRISGDKLVACKMRSIHSKVFGQWGGMDAKALFNSETINALQCVLVTEGEFDTCIVEQGGFPAVSIANSTTKLTPEIRNQLKQAECIYLAGDNDGGVGNAAMKQLARELGENTYLVVWPNAKDANEFFLKECKGNVADFRTRLDGLMRKAKNTPIEGFTSLLERLRSTGGTDASNDPYRLHFAIPALDSMACNPPGSIVVFYSTYSGTGKTVFTTQVMLDEAKRGETVVVFSPELRDESYLALVTAQTIGQQRPGGLDRTGAISAEDYNEAAKQLDVPTLRGTDFTFYVGHTLPAGDSKEVLEFIEQAIRCTGATRFVIDTLHRLVDKMPRESQTEAEGRIVKELERLGRKYGTIFILIGQSNKEAEDLKELRRDSEGVLRGSRELTDVAYTIYLLHRKKKQAEEGQEIKDLLENETAVILKKVREKGKGSPIVSLIYRPEVSKFYLLEKGGDSGKVVKAEQKNSNSDIQFGEDSPF